MRNSGTYTYNNIFMMPDPDIILKFPNNYIHECNSYVGIKGRKEGGSRPTEAYVFGKINPEVFKSLYCTMHPINHKFFCIDEEYDRNTFKDKELIGCFDEFECTFEELQLRQLVEY